jgi:signal peptidase I
MGIRHYLALRKARKQLKELRTHARGLYHMRRDIMSPEASSRLGEALAAARRCLRRAGTLEEATHAASALEQALAGWAPLHRSGWTENFEVLLVALGVAMAFRCYFFQPFKIPTGSMQPTLYGIHSEERDAPTLFDKPPLKQLTWLVTGDWYREVRVAAGGQVKPLLNDESKPGYVTFQIAGRRYHVPSDAVFARRALRVGREGHIEPGAVLWSGIVHSGDHVFVNRVLWNFRRPRRGEVMVFSTQAIKGLPQGTHYIKRMTGLPNETIGIRPPDLLVNGKPVTEPFTIGRIVRREKLASWAPPYAGYRVIGIQAQIDFEPALRAPGDTVTLGGDEYYAMGDNTHNSRDSRYWGPVPERNLLGPACLVYWPFTSPRFGQIQ